MDGDLIAGAIRLLGSFLGAILALVFQPPKSIAEFVTRAVFSLICGLLFGDILRDYVKWTATWQTNMAAASIAAMLSWFIMGAATRIIGQYKQPPK